MDKIFAILYIYFQAFGVFGLCQIVAFAQWMRSKMSPETFQFVLRSVLLVIGGAFGMMILIATFLQSMFLFALKTGL